MSTSVAALRSSVYSVYGNTLTDIGLTATDSTLVVVEDKTVGTKDTAVVETLPDGGLEAWKAVAGATLIQICAFGYTNAFGVYQDYYKRVYISNASSSAISWIGSVNVFFVLISGIWAGPLYDRGYFRHLLYGGCFLVSFSLFMLSLTEPNSLWQNFLAQGVGLGLGAGMLDVPSMAILSQYFGRRRILAMTIASSGVPFGSSIHSVMLNNLFASRLGFKNGVRVSAALITAMLIVATSMLRPRIVRHTNTPIPANILPSFRDSVPTFFREWSFICLLIGVFFYSLGIDFPLYYIQLDAVKHGVNERLSSYVIVVLNISSFLGRLAPGPFVQSSRGVVIMVTLSALACSTVIFGMSGLTGIGSAMSLAVLYGLSFGIFTTLQAPLVAVLTKDVSQLGARLGVVSAISAVGSLVGPPIQGALLADQFIWWRPALVSGLLFLVATAMYGSIFFTERRDIQKESSLKDPDAEKGMP